MAVCTDLLAFVLLVVFFFCLCFKGQSFVPLTPFFNMSPTISALCGAEQNEGTTSPMKLLRLLSSARTRALPRPLFRITPVPLCVCALEQMRMKGTHRSDCHKLWQCSLLLVSVGGLSWASPSD